MIIKILLGILAVLLLWGIGDILYDIHFFRVTPYHLKDQRIKKPFRFVVLSDLHDKRFGKGNCRLIKTIRRLSPDAVLVAGDMVTAKGHVKIAPAAELFEILSTEFPVYYGMGNHEERIKRRPDLYGDVYGAYAARLKKCGIEPLENLHASLPEYGIRIYGFTADKRFYRRFHNLPMPEEYLAGCLGKRDESQYTILLAHNPDYFADYSAWGADLVLSGHNHGGIVHVPLLGGMVAAKCTLFPKYDAGYFKEGKSVMLLSRGLGTHTLPVRVLNRAELLYVTLEP